MDRIPVIIDTDPGHDDAIALMMALASDRLDIRGITIVAGNNTIENTTNNAIRIIENFGRSIKVYKGAERPMVQILETPVDIHGKTGLDGTSLLEAKGRAEDKNAIQFLEDELKSTSERITIIAIGPLTNIGTLLAAAPEMKDRIDEICIMGGAALGGNKTPTSEFNIWQDPEAAHIVFTSGIPVTMCGLDVTYKSSLFEADVERINKIGNKAGILASEILDFYGKAIEGRGNKGIAVHDAVAVAKILRPDLFKSEMYNVVIDLDGKYTRGCTVTDLINVTGAHKNAEVVLDVDRERFVDFMVESLEKLGSLQEVAQNA
ncbi:nucleoside hydrolase [Youngiibacter fragilis]|uniref:Ribonucleoside hydrolase n=1 Tax=Youngiibacter fragilis 232.1 TaxID=994573 RepID=V7I3C7_9CLOT|nr:nucleoside hydrolase [Youngiibacter fragilis]ETA80750.1 ribonucleoside hydrolase [Youngiibacter fragilis 232.1]